jgi:hypothetical protein
MYRGFRTPTPYPSPVLVGQLVLVSEGWGTHTRFRGTVSTSKVLHTVRGVPSVRREAPPQPVPSDQVKKKIAVCTAGVARKVNYSKISTELTKDFSIVY